MTINELETKLGLKDEHIYKMFGLKNIQTLRCSSAKNKYKTALCDFYEFLKSDQNKENK